MRKNTKESAGTSKPETETGTNTPKPGAEEEITDEQWKQILGVLFDRGDPLPKEERIRRAQLRLKKAISELNR
jgi:hypothetical protein